jgi:hypothetical protein
MQNIVAKDAAAGEARKKVEDDHELAAMIKDNLRVITGVSLNLKIFFFRNSGLMKQRPREGKRGATQRCLNRR